MLTTTVRDTSTSRPPSAAGLRRVLVAAALLAIVAAAGCTRDPPGRGFGATCDGADACGCFDPATPADDPECVAPGTTAMDCVAQHCSLACVYGPPGDSFCRAHFRPSTGCAFEGYCRE